MQIDDSVDWYFDINVGAEVGRGVNRGVDSDFDYEVRRCDNEGVELYVGDKVGSINWQKCYKGAKCVIVVFIKGVDSRRSWGIERVIGAGNGITDGITFGLDDWYDMGYSDGLFDVFSVRKHMK